MGRRPHPTDGETEAPPRPLTRPALPAGSGKLGGEAAHLPHLRPLPESQPAPSPLLPAAPGVKGHQRVVTLAQHISVRHLCPGVAAGTPGGPREARLTPDPTASHRPAGGHHAGLHPAPPAAARHAPPRAPLLLPRRHLPRPGPPPRPQRPLPPAPRPRRPRPRLPAQRRGQEVSARLGCPPLGARAQRRSGGGETGAPVRGHGRRVRARGLQAPRQHLSRSAWTPAQPREGQAAGPVSVKGLRREEAGTHLPRGSQPVRAELGLQPEPHGARPPGPLGARGRGDGRSRLRPVHSPRAEVGSTFPLFH